MNHDVGRSKNLQQFTEKKAVAKISTARDLQRSAPHANDPQRSSAM